jgi:hypothetical protein
MLTATAAPDLAPRGPSLSPGGGSTGGSGGGGGGAGNLDSRRDEFTDPLGSVVVAVHRWGLRKEGVLLEQVEQAGSGSSSSDPALFSVQDMWARLAERSSSSSSSVAGSTHPTSPKTTLSLAVSRFFLNISLVNAAAVLTSPSPLPSVRAGAGAGSGSGGGKIEIEFEIEMRTGRAASAEQAWREGGGSGSGAGAAKWTVWRSGRELLALHAMLVGIFG